MSVTICFLSLFLAFWPNSNTKKYPDNFLSTCFFRSCAFNLSRFYILFLISMENFLGNIRPLKNVLHQQTVIYYFFSIRSLSSDQFINFFDKKILRIPSFTLFRLQEKEKFFCSFSIECKMKNIFLFWMLMAPFPGGLFYPWNCTCFPFIKRHSPYEWDAKLGSGSEFSEKSAEYNLTPTCLRPQKV